MQGNLAAELAGGSVHIYIYISQINELKLQHFRAQLWQCAKDSPIPVSTVID